MFEDWFSYVGKIVGGVFASYCLLEGGRRLRVSNMHRTALAMVAFGALYFALFGALAQWSHKLLSEPVDVTSKGRFTSELPQDWGKDMSPEKREASSLSYARIVYLRHGKLVNYFERSGTARPFAPSQDDLRQREATVASDAKLQTMADATSGASVYFWLWGFLCLLFGLVLVDPKTPANPTAEPDARKGGARGSP